MSVTRSMLLFVPAALAEIGGARLVWQGVREHRGVAFIGAGIAAPGGTVDTHRGRTQILRAKRARDRRVGFRGERDRHRGGGRGLALAEARAAGPARFVHRWAGELGGCLPQLASQAGELVDLPAGVTVLLGHQPVEPLLDRSAALAVPDLDQVGDLLQRAAQPLGPER